MQRVSFLIVTREDGVSKTFTAEPEYMDDLADIGKVMMKEAKEQGRTVSVSFGRGRVPLT